MKDLRFSSLFTTGLSRYLDKVSVPAGSDRGASADGSRRLL